MAGTMNVLFLAAEADPFIKVGGLGDVAGSLPRAIQSLPPELTSGITPDVRLVVPFHAAIRSSQPPLRLKQVYSVARGSSVVPVRVFESRLGDVPVYLLDAPPVASTASVYASDSSLDREKYLFFSVAALELTSALNWRPDIVHANDWHTAIAVYGVHMRRRGADSDGASTVLTIHNLPFMGPDMGTALGDYGFLPVRTGLPEWASSRPLPLGIWAADAIVAVSPTYAREIQQRASGCGLDQYLHSRQESLHGILNGIDVDRYNPASDPALATNYGVPTLDRRVENKRALQARLGLVQDESVPLFGVVSRLDRQKGTDLLPAAFSRLLDLDWQLVILGTGQPKLEETLRRLQQEMPGRVRCEIRFDSDLAQQIYGGADALLMPSRYEPCGLAQMMAMRYGCVPVVSAVGGLLDTVEDGKTGILIGAPTVARLAAGIKRTMSIHCEAARWRQLQCAAMSQDFSWTASARKYLELYRSLISSRELTAS